MEKNWFDFVNQKCRTESEAHNAIGMRITHAGSEWRVVDHNDLGVIYWQVHGKDGRPKGKMFCNSELDRKAGLAGAY